MIQLEQRLLTVDEYQQMVAAGILEEDDPIELLNGQLIKMSPSGSKHAACVEKIDECLKELFGYQAMIRSQNPIVLGLYSEPEPDIAVVRRKDNYYSDRHPVPEEIYLLIEVSDSSLEKDRQVKGEVYATAQIPEYWIVNLAKQEIEIYQKPVDGRYETHNILTFNDEIQVPLVKQKIAVHSLIL